MPSCGASSIAFIFGLIFVFQILAAQYESWSLPFALLDALLAIFLHSTPNEV